MTAELPDGAAVMRAVAELTEAAASWPPVPYAVRLHPDDVDRLMRQCPQVAGVPPIWWPRLEVLADDAVPVGEPEFVYRDDQTPALPVPTARHRVLRAAHHVLCVDRRWARVLPSWLWDCGWFCLCLRYAATVDNTSEPYGWRYWRQSAREARAEARAGRAV